METTAPKKTGRPRLAPGRKKAATLQARVTDELEARAQACADAEGVSLSSWLRQLVIDRIEYRYAIDARTAGLAALVAKCRGSISGVFPLTEETLTDLGIHPDGAA